MEARSPLHERGQAAGGNPLVVVRDVVAVVLNAHGAGHARAGEGQGLGGRVAAPGRGEGGGGHLLPKMISRTMRTDATECCFVKTGPIDTLGLSTAECLSSSLKCSLTTRSASVLATPYPSPRSRVDQSFQSCSVNTWSRGTSYR